MKLIGRKVIMNFYISLYDLKKFAGLVNFERDDDYYSNKSPIIQSGLFVVKLFYSFDKLSSV